MCFKRLVPYSYSLFFPHSFPSPLLILTTICLCFFKIPSQANVYCSSVPTGDQSLSYIHGLPRRNIRDRSLERMARGSSDQPEVPVLRLDLFSIVDDGYYLMPVDFNVEQIMRQFEDGLEDIRSHTSNQPPRSSLVTHRHTANVSTELLIFLLPSSSSNGSLRDPMSL